jgi:dolichol kinase
MTDFTIVASIWNTIFTFFLFTLVICLFYIAHKSSIVKNRYGGTSTFICACIILFFAFYNNVYGLLEYPFNGFMMWWNGALVGIYLGFAYYIRHVEKKLERNPPPASQEQKKTITMILLEDEQLYVEQLPLKMEAVRKGFHLAGFLLILSYYGFFFIWPIAGIVNDTVIDYIHIPWVESQYNLLWGDIIADYPYVKQEFQATIDLTFFALIATMEFALLSDLIRTLWGARYSVFNVLTRAILRKKEYNAAGPQIYLISGVCFSYLLYKIGCYPVGIAMAASLVACFSDAIAALIGRKYGKHKVSVLGGDTKSIEGFIAGAGSAYLFALIFIGPLHAIFAALIFFLLDYFPIRIADNLTNPILISLGLWLFSIIIPIHIGW